MPNGKCDIIFTYTLHCPQTVHMGNKQGYLGAIGNEKFILTYCIVHNSIHGHKE